MNILLLMSTPGNANRCLSCNVIFPSKQAYHNHMIVQHIKEGLEKSQQQTIRFTNSTPSPPAPVPTNFLCLYCGVVEQCYCSMRDHVHFLHPGKVSIKNVEGRCSPSSNSFSRCKARLDQLNAMFITGDLPSQGASNVRHSMYRF